MVALTFPRGASGLDSLLGGANAARIATIPFIGMD
jgi:hypothetical protein